MTKQVKFLKQPELLPVLRLSPFDFDEAIYPFTKEVDQETLYLYWKSVLEKNGLAKLEPIQKGLHLVSVKDIDLESLGQLIDHYLEDDFDIDLEEGVFSFEGGVVLKSEGQVMVTPQCCVSLEDYREWTRIDRNENFERIWIGHPWIYYRVREDRLYMTGLIEKTLDKTSWRHYDTPDNTMLVDASNFREKASKEVGEEDVKYALDFSTLQEAIKAMEKDLNEFEGKIIKVLEQKGLEQAKEIAHCFINGNGNFLSYDPNDAD